MSRSIRKQLNSGTTALVVLYAPPVNTFQFAPYSLACHRGVMLIFFSYYYATFCCI